MKGQTVWVRDFHGVIHRRRIWSGGRDLIYVTNDEQFERLKKGLPALVPLGFPREDVFFKKPKEKCDEN